LVFELGCLCRRQSGLVCLDSDERWWLIVLCEIFNDIYRHSNVDPAVIVVPSSIGLSSKGCEQMSQVLITNIFDARVNDIGAKVEL
jgi:hypothetical protein